LIKRILKRIHRAAAASNLYQRIAHPHKSLSEIHSYWQNPTGGNQPECYLAEEETLQKRSRYLVSLLERLAKPDARILEIGCNAGRNLSHLFEAGYRNLEAIEISENAVALLRKSFPEMASQIRVHCTPVEEIIKTFPDGAFDVVFTMAVLEHVHTASEWIFPEMVRITKGLLITIEDERGLSWRHFPRNYQSIFEPLGVRQVEWKQCRLEEQGLGDQFFTRVFAKGSTQ
jgi:2-polyprenyl-3-methyl-5-hydroxy-6-metoxy-1,4-benzoquinol methylase